MLVADEAEQRSKQFIETAVKEFKIFIDTCSLLSEDADKFWANITPVLQRESKTVIIPYRVYEELDKFASNPSLCLQKSPNKPSLNHQAINVKSNVAVLQRAGLIEIFGDSNDNFADNVFQTVFTKFRLKYSLMLITQDNNLANDIVNISKSKSVNTNNRILVERINKFGFLSKFSFNKHPKRYNEPNTNHVHIFRRPQYSVSTEIPDKERFASAKVVTTVRGKILVSYIPKEGDVVIAERGEQRKPIKIIKFVAAGGEGTIYMTDIPDVVAKIYKEEKIDKAKHKKLKLMLTKSIDCVGICFPLAVIYNSNNEFVGYLMKKAHGTELQKCVFIPQLLKKKFPTWKKNDTVELCITILKKLKYLHDRNIILGDINPNNILVVSPKEVYFVDADSYQIEGFPCPVGTINFTAPEIQRKKYETFLRSLGNERFAVATLLFMIMLPGKPPYSLQGGENQIDNIINGDFAYASGDRSTGKAPEGIWRYCWSHLPRYLKDDFYETFRKGGEHSEENTRYSTGDWLKKFEYYLSLLTSGKFAEQDEISMELFPTRLKKNKNTTYIKCKICHNDVDEERAEQGICPDCLRKGEIYRCAKCGCEMKYTNYQKLIKHSRRYDICKDCNDKKNMVYTRAHCSDCGKIFEITYGEKDFFESKGYQLPKRCVNCRGSRASISSYYRSRSRTLYTPPPKRKPEQTPPKKSSGGLCFITTAVCEYLNKPDDCYELTILRGFRDNWLAAQPSGEALIKEYYKIAPIIVTALNLSNEKETIYRNLWSKYISPCIKLIELKAYSTCMDLYMEMVNNLKLKFVKE
jgi:serine/threonine protein kinase